MKHRCVFFSTIPLVLVPFSALLAQGSIPAEIRTKMDGYLGNWTVRETVKDSPSSPETTYTGTWEARWLYDGFIEWKATGTMGGKTTSSVEYEGYDPVMQGYSYWFVSDGSRGHAYDGQWEGNTITIQTVAFGVDGAVSRGRCTWPYNDDFTAIRDYFCEQLTDGKWWVSRRGTATKVGG